MFTRVVMLQPMGTMPEPPEPVPAAAEGADAGPSPTTVVSGTMVVNGGGGGATQELCEKVNQEATYATLGYGLAASLVALVVFVVLEKKHVASAGRRLTIAVLLASLLAFALAFLDPARADAFLLCLNDPSTVVYLTLGAQPVARALAMGFTPALFLTLIFCVVARRFV